MLDENCYVLSDDISRECVIIDCGALYEPEHIAIINYIRDKNLKPIHLLCTHGHLDHNFGNGAIFQTFGLQAEVHFADKNILETINDQATKFFGVSLNCTTAPIGKLLNGTEKISYGSQVLDIIYTPGHTEGSVVFHNKEQKIAFTGDTLFQMSIGRTDLEGGDYEKIISSLHLIATTLPPETTIYPGHGPSTTMQKELQYNPYLKKCSV
ncbi:MAG: MBL fold metallo-hydrolase [Bacteroidaceae bacterium]|nr:MBL fold metallo-hydrolase [Bacteroidaceae bacterium]